MSLDGILAIAGSGIADINAALAVAGQNVANAGTAGWTAEQSEQESATAGGIGIGVRALPASRDLDAVLEAAVFQQNATAAGLQTQQNALSAIDQMQGTVGGGTDLASLVAGLQGAFATLSADPANQTQQQAVVSAAQSVATQLNALSGAVQQQRQAAQNDAVSQVATLNATLQQVGALNAQIMRAQAGGLGTADLMNQRDAAIGTLSAIVPVRQVPQADGGVLLVTTGGLTLPTTGAGFSLAAATMGPGTTYPSTAVPALMLGGQDVTTQMGDGALGADLTLRDDTLPAYQGTLDEFSYTLASRFSAQGLTLFSDAGGNVPQGGGTPVQQGYVGFAQSITVNPAVAADPSLVRDGTQDVAGSASGASAFTVNPSGGPADFTGMIERVLDYTFGADVQDGVTQPAAASTGLGPAGDESAGFLAGGTLGDFAGALVGKMSADVGTNQTALTGAQSLQTGLQAKLSSQSGVSIDAEMSTMIALQNAYAANAKVMTAVQAMWASLLAMVQ